MYYEHFGLSGAPFEFNPSASVLFMSAGHREGLAALEWGLREPSGFTMLVGEIGTGKTTLIYSLLANRHQGVRTAWVANPRITFEEMLRQILGQLGIDQPVNSGKLNLLQAFDAQLASLGPDECIAVIIDEAQDLSDEALEDIRLLSNFQSLERRRLQMVLVGQIDLAKRLARQQLRQLNQRIGARALLPTLQGREIYDYIEYRVRARGGDIERLFTRGAIREISRASYGIPRRINVLCHNSLFLAFADGEHCVSERHVQDACRDYDHLPGSEASGPAKMAASASAAIQAASTAMRSASASMRLAAAAESTTIPEMPLGQPSRPIRAMAVSLFVALCLVGMAAAGMFELDLARKDLPALARRFESQAAQLKARLAVERDAAESPTGSEPVKIPARIGADSAAISVHRSSVLNTEKSNELTHGPYARSSATARVAKERQTKTGGAPDTGTSTETTVMVKAGDTLSKIAQRLYGSLGGAELARLTAANPQIKDVNVIYPGQTIHVQQATNDPRDVTHE